MNNINQNNLPAKQCSCGPSCEICGGIGFIRRTLPVEDPDFGRLQLCPNRDPFEVFGKNCGLQKTECSFSWPDLIDCNGVYKVIDEIREVLTLGYGFVYIWGDFGLGKTKMLMTTVAESIRARKSAIYCRMLEILDDVRTGYSQEFGYSEDIRRFRRYLEIPILCIDEFDRIKPTEFSLNKREELVDYRYRTVQQKMSTTLFASNQDPKFLGQFIADRVHDGRFKIIHLEGYSARPNITRW